MTHNRVTSISVSMCRFIHSAIPANPLSARTMQTKMSLAGAWKQLWWSSSYGQGPEDRLNNPFTCCHCIFSIRQRKPYTGRSTYSGLQGHLSKSGVVR